MRNIEQSPLERLFQHFKEYLIAQRNLALTVASQKGGSVIYGIVLAIALFMIGWFFLLIFSMGAAFGIGALLDSTFWGFMIVAALYLITGALIWIFREKLLRTPIQMLFLKFVNTDKAEAHEQEQER